MATPALFDLGGLQGIDDRYAGKHQHERIEEADDFDQVDVVRRRPDRAPKRITMYAPINAAKNMISVDRNSHMNSLPFGSGKRGLINQFDVMRMFGSGHDGDFQGENGEWRNVEGPA